MMTMKMIQKKTATTEMTMQKAAKKTLRHDDSNHHLFLVLTAAGSSTRMGTGSKKEYLSLHGGTVLSEAARIFLETAPFEAVVITTPKDGEQDARNALFKDEKVKQLLNTQNEGGATRQQSVYHALLALKQKSCAGAIVLIHDAARPYVTSTIITEVINAAAQYRASVPALTPVDTQKEMAKDGTMRRHLVRNELAAVQTPQAFLLEPRIAAHALAATQDKAYTDDTEIWDSFPQCTAGKKVHVVPGDSCNKKITYPQDIPQDASCNEKTKGHEMIHTGFGTDLHRLVPGRKLMLGGVEIPFDKGELGHSDGDVLLHAVTDALLGASGLGDIGSYFPPEDAKWKDADSALLLKKVWNDITNEGWKLCNLDCVVEIEQPKFLPYRNDVIHSIATILEVNDNQVFVKAKTNEKLESVGTGEAVKAYCSCLLER